jgi:CubicO group peptidase (beta-lactamase class C family)
LEALPAARPADVGLSAAKLADLDAKMQEYVDENRLAGILTLIARDGKVAHVGIHGKKDIDANEPIERDTIFRIYSMSKPITTAALMTLYEEGKFDLDDPAAKYLPELADMKVYVGKEGDQLLLEAVNRPITIRDLMRHTSGLAYGLAPINPVEKMYREAQLLRKENTLDELMSRLTKLPLLAQPGTQWSYSIAVDVQGKLIEKLSGKRLDQFLRERIFEPLKMVDTGFYVPSDKLDRFATNYGPKTGGGLVPIDKPESSPFASEQNLLSGGGGLVSTADDYLRFAQMMLNRGELDGKRILKAETVEMMTKNQLPDKLVPIRLGILPIPRTGFGLGVAVKVSQGESEPGNSVGEFMWGGAASTQFFVAPHEDMVAIIMTQYMPMMQTHILEFRNKVYETIEESAAVTK